MTLPRLTYFDVAASRGEECRLALHLAGVAFEDHRLTFQDWPALKPRTPFGALPLLELPGKPPLAQSNAILVYVGREHGLHPKGAFEAALHEAMMAHVEDLRSAIGATLFLPEAEKKAAREKLASSAIPDWGARTERMLGDGPFFGGSKLHVVDLKLYMATRWLTSGTLDHIPGTIFADLPRLLRLHDAVRDDPGVKGWYARG